MTKQKDPAGRVQLLLMSLVFFGPLILATWLYVSGTGFQPTGRTNHGELLEPLVNIGDVLPGAPIHQHNEGHWLLVYSNTGACDEACEFALLTLRQSRLMLGKEMDRLRRVFLHGDTAPDTVFLANEHSGLISIQDSNFSDLLHSKRPRSSRQVAISWSIHSVTWSCISVPTSIRAIWSKTSITCWNCLE